MKAMNNIELRIGNQVEILTRSTKQENPLSTGNTGFVYELKNDNVRVLLKGKKTNKEYALTRKYNEIRGIKLSQKILLNNGFEIFDGSDNWFHIKLNEEELIFSCNLFGVCNIRHKGEMISSKDSCFYVHELQNIIYSLTKKQIIFQI